MEKWLVDILGKQLESPNNPAAMGFGLFIHEQDCFLSNLTSSIHMFISAMSQN